MQKSIFKRYLSITMAIVILSFIMLGSVMMLFFSRYWRDEKNELLTKNASSIAGMASRFLTEKEADKYELQTEVLRTFIASFSTSIDADIFITDLEGNILLGNYANSKLKDPGKVPVQAAPSRPGAASAACITAAFISLACPWRFRTAAPAWARCSPLPARPP